MGVLEGGGAGHELAVVVVTHGDGVAGTQGAEALLQFGEGVDGGVVDADDDVLLGQAEVGAGTSFFHVVYVYAGGGALDVELLGELGVEGSTGDTENAALHAAVGLEVGDYLGDDGGGDGKAIAGVGAGAGVDGGVDADELSVEVHQCAPGIAWVDGGVRLEVALDAHAALGLTRALEGSALGRDDAGRDGGVESEGVADGKHPFAYLDVVGVAEDYGLEIGGVDLDEGEVGGLVAADDGGGVRGVIVEEHFELLGSVDDVVVGDYVAVGGDDDAGAGSGLLGFLLLLFLLLGLLLLGHSPAEEVEEVAEGIAVVLLAGSLVALDAYHGVDGLLGGHGEVGLEGRGTRGGAQELLVLGHGRAAQGERQCCRQADAA